MADRDGVDERISHQAADQADDAVGCQYPRGRIFIARGLGAFDVVHGLDQIVDAERNRRHQDDAEEFEAREYFANCRNWNGETEARARVADALDAQAPESEAEQVRSPRDDHADRD